MPIWAVVLLCLGCSFAGWVTGGIMLSEFICAKLARRVGRRQAMWLLRPESEP